MYYSALRCPPATNADSRWPYHHYYIGDKDKEERRDGKGENHWSGAESLEWYNGQFVHDTMHGVGEYRWRYKGPEGKFITYEGMFYGNRMHGYGVMSYPDGRVFNGIFYNNMRWGPGTESNTFRRQSVGLWRGNQLVRLCWRPKTPSVCLDFNFGPPTAKTMVEAHRTLLATNVRNFGEVNSAIELLKQSGATPIVATEKWAKLYPKNCNDLASQVCHVELFDHQYYKHRVVELDQIDTLPEPSVEIPRNSKEYRNSRRESMSGVYYAWNNSEVMVNMMKHCYKHEYQRATSRINLTTLLSGPRSQYRNADKHELDCRNLIMCSYLGDIHAVAQLINEEHVHPDVADVLGNTALMYATCGNQTQVIHFLIEAGADVNSFNDSCCTPLAVALLTFVCLSKDILPGLMFQALSPPPKPFSLPVQATPSDWYISREISVFSDNDTTNKLEFIQKKSTTSIGDKRKNKVDQNAKNTNGDFNKKKKSNVDEIKKKVANAEDLPREENKTSEEVCHDRLCEEFVQKVTDWFYMPLKTEPPKYLYEVSDIVKEINAGLEEHKDVKDKGKIKTTHVKTITHDAVTKDILKPSQDKMGLESPKLSLTSEELAKMEMLEKNMSTIAQLLSDGANPQLVRCPQSALFTAVMSGSSTLVYQLVQYGADVNEVYPDALSYTILDMAMSRPPTKNTVDLVQVILENGGRVDHRLKCEDVETPGPTLLHAVLTKHIEDNEDNDEICCQLLDLLLEYGSSAEEQYNGSSAMDVAMEKSFKLFDVLIKSPKTNLNAVINDENQTILVKMFSMEFFRDNPIAERLQTLTNLLLYGADPLLECQNNDVNYGNIFVFAKKCLNEMDPQSIPGEKSEGGIAKVSKKNLLEKAKKEEKKASKIPPPKGLPKVNAEDIADYKQAVGLVRDCARILHIRWIQAKLMRELLGVVEKYEHRQWNMILPEHKHKKACGLWLSMPRCLEIWDIFQTSKKKKCTDRRIIKHILCMIHFYCDRSKTSLKWPLIAEEKNAIDTDAALILREHKIAAEMATQRLTKPFVSPELAGTAERKFQVCFECAIPLVEDSIKCDFCKQVSFCTLDCMKLNIQEHSVGIHPCSQYLQTKYFPTPVESFTQAQDQTNLM